MNINNNYNNNVYFGAKISHSVEKLVNIQLHHERTRTRKLAAKQIENIKNWGPENSELILAKNKEGNISLGVRYPINEHVNGYWPIEHLNCKTVLSGILKLHEEHLDNTVKNIIYLYKTRGARIFDDIKVQTIYDKVHSWKS